ncbi:MAG: hypothetical protein IPL59_17680 [Candidatus Competibacteraceae bacterium]|nr:hypothetical protein [Candidatus Competibacteraceae bacterium]
MVINDIGPRIPVAGLQRVSDLRRPTGYLRQHRADGTLHAHHRRPFCNLSDAQWRHMTIHSSRQLEDVRDAMACDPESLTSRRWI